MRGVLSETAEGEAAAAFVGEVADMTDRCICLRYHRVPLRETAGKREQL